LAPSRVVCLEPETLIVGALRAQLSEGGAISRRRMLVARHLDAFVVGSGVSPVKQVNPIAAFFTAMSILAVGEIAVMRERSLVLRLFRQLGLR